MKNAPIALKPTPILDETAANPAADLNDEATEIETAQLQMDDDINFDDGIDDDNENPVSHTLINAAENRGEQARDNSQELDGEAKEDRER